MNLRYALALSVCTYLPSLAAQRPGDYAGWVYEEPNGDFPIRLHIHQGANTAWQGSVDLPAHRRLRIPLQVEVKGDRMVQFLNKS